MKYFFRLLILGLFLFGYLERSSAQYYPADSVIAKIDALLESDAAKFKFSGTVLIAQNGKMLLEKGYGWKDFKKGIANDTASIFQIGSLTKQFTSALIFKLQEQGRLSISDPVSKFFPGFPNGGRITLQQLLNHTSGLYNYTNGLGPLQLMFSKTRTKKAMVDMFANRPLEFQPGSAFRYTSSGYFLLGMVIETVTGKPYEQVLREEIFRPLGMLRSGFDFRNLRHTAVTTGYSVLNKDMQSVASVVDSTILYSAGGMYSTIGDLFRWEQGLSQGKVITMDSWTKMTTPYLNNYANGIGTGTKFGKRYLTHAGQTSSYSAQLLSFPEDATCIIVLSNVAGDQWNRSVTIAQLLYEQSYPWGNNAPLEKAPALSSLGTYRHALGLQLTVAERNGKLMLTGSPGSGVSSGELLMISETGFYFRPLQLDIQIITEDGRQKLISGRSGNTQEWIKELP